jgi:hypothetical protein
MVYPIAKINKNKKLLAHNLDAAKTDEIINLLFLIGSIKNKNPKRATHE